jgi:hypothetical protein
MENTEGETGEISLAFSLLEKFTKFMEIAMDTESRIIIGVENEWFTLSPTFLSDIREKITERIHEGYGSDENAIRAFRDLGFFTVQSLSINRNKKQEESGKNFRYTHTLPYLNLEAYGIFTDPNMVVERNSCFVTVLKQLGAPLSLVNSAKLTTKLSGVNEKWLLSFCKKHNCVFKIRRCYHGKSQLRTLGTEGKIYEFCLVDNHYFKYDKETGVSKIALNNFDLAIKHDENWKFAYKKVGTKVFCNEKLYKPINSFDLVKTLLSSDFLEPIPLQIWQKTPDYIPSTEVKIENLSDEIVAEDFFKVKKVEQKPKKVRRIVGYFDFESSVNTTNETKGHIGFCVSCKFENQPKKTFLGLRCTLAFLDYIKKHCGKKTKTQVVMFAHNLRYDFSFLIDYLNPTTFIENGNRVLLVKAHLTKNIELVLKDSLSFISEPLRKFPEMFGLGEIKKEIMPYMFFTEKRLKSGRRMYPIEKFCETLSEEDKVQLISNANEINCIEDDEIDIYSYAKFYCERDIDVLEKGFTKFRGMMKKLTGNDPVDFVSISQFSAKYFTERGVFKSVYKVTGITRQYLHKALIGGRVCTAYNEKLWIKGMLDDQDANSLYPSSMERITNDIGGFPSRKPKIFGKMSLATVQRRFKVAVVSVKILSINKPRAIPCHSVDEGIIRDWTNVPVDKVYVLGLIALEDIVKFHKAEIEIVGGLGWKQVNTNAKISIGKLARELYDYRSELKKNENPLQIVVKLIMNACYGKLIQKPFDKQVKFGRIKDFNEFVTKNFLRIKSITKFKNKFKSNMEVNPISHSNSVVAGIMILDMARRIMNEVIYTAEDAGIPTFYTDTDSIHIPLQDKAALGRIYQRKFGRELFGKDLGQFSSDFGEQYSTEAIFLGKKSYMDFLSNGKYHFRLKGVPQKSVLKYPRVDMVYETLFRGESLDFSLASIENPRFRRGQNLKIYSIASFNRIVEFPNEGKYFEIIGSQCTDLPVETEVDDEVDTEPEDLSTDNNFFGSKIVLYEKVDVNKVNWILNNRETAKKFIRESAWETCFEQLKKYSGFLHKSPRIQYVESEYHKSSNENSMWYIDGVGLQNMCREIRGTICKEFYYDLDIVNCQMTILSQFLERNGIFVPFMKSYVRNRESILAKLCEKTKLSRDEMKMVLIAILNGDKKKYNSIKPKPYFLNSFYRECQRTRVSFSDEFWDECNLYDGKRNSAVSAICHKNYEICNQIISSLAEELDGVAKTKTFSVLTFDGIQIERDRCTVSPAKLVEMAEEFVYRKFNYKVNFKIKDFEFIPIKS